MDKEWIYIKEKDNKVRYILGTKGNHTLCCIGINPSTAEPNKPDPTIRSVERISKGNGYDSFIMFNVYPVRSTIFENLSMEENHFFMEKNINEIIKIVKSLPKPINIWLAYGNLIDKRNYMRDGLNKLLNELNKYDCNYWTCGITKNGNPKHPLYLNSNTKLEPLK